MIWENNFMLSVYILIIAIADFIVMLIAVCKADEIIEDSKVSH